MFVFFTPKVCFVERIAYLFWTRRIDLLIDARTDAADHITAPLVSTQTQLKVHIVYSVSGQVQTDIYSTHKVI